MANIKIGITSIIFPESEANATQIYLDAIDYKESKGLVEIPDEAVIKYIENSNELDMKRKSWENGFKVKSFSTPGFNDKYSYYLETAKPKAKTPGVVDPSPGKELSYKDIRGRLDKKESTPSDVVDVTLTEAKGILEEKFHAGEIDFIKEVKSYLSTYKDEQLEEVVDHYLNQLTHMAEGVKFTKASLMEQGSRYVNKLAISINLKNINNYDTKEALIDAILIKHKASNKNKRELSKKM